MNFKEELENILKNDPLELLILKPATSPITSDQRLISSFVEINDLGNPIYGLEFVDLPKEEGFVADLSEPETHAILLTSSYGSGGGGQQGKCIKLRDMLSDKTRLVAVGCASNASGGINLVQDIIDGNAAGTQELALPAALRAPLDDEPANGVTIRLRLVTAGLKIERVAPSQLANAPLTHSEPDTRSILINAPPNASCSTQELIIPDQPVLSQVSSIKLLVS